MRINNEMAKLINEQANREHFSAMLYLSFACFFEKKNLRNLAAFYKKSYEEELSHMNKFYQYLSDRGADCSIATMQSIPVPASTEAIVQATFEHENKVTKYLLILKQDAQKAGDLQTDTLLDWFISEQVEEENKAEELMQKYAAAASVNAQYGELYLDQIVGEMND